MYTRAIIRPCLRGGQRTAPALGVALPAAPTPALVAARPTAALAACRRSLHSTARHCAIDAQTHETAKAWNLAARLGTREELESLERWLSGFRKDSIPVGSFDLRHARSSGAGGQNVNKVNTKVDLRFRLDSASWMPPLARKCLRQLERGRLNGDGEFVVTSERTRTQAGNFDDCVDKLYAMIVKACELPKATDPSKTERIKKLGDAEKARRRENKQFRSDKKASRRDWRD